MEIVFITIHVLATGALVAAVLVPLMVVFKKTVDQRDLQLLSQLKWLGTGAIVVLVLSGLALMSDTDTPGEHTSGRWIFLTKLGLIVVSGILANLIIERHVKRARHADQTASQPFLRRWLVLHTLVVVAIIVLGILMSFGS